MTLPIAWSEPSEFTQEQLTDMTTPTPTDIVLHQRSRVLEVAFEDGSRFQLPCEYLRVESPSAEVQGHGPGQKVLVAGKRAVGIGR
jgi:DUF971 family protein